jgi:5-methylcytosine-specific restriction endonuclease McrA
MAEYAAGGVIQSGLGKRWGVSQATIQRIVAPGARECQRAYDTARRAVPEVRDRHRAAAAAWSAAHPERKRATNAAWYAANPEHVRAYAAAWRAANPERSRAQGQRRRARKRGAPGDGGYTGAEQAAIKAALYVDQMCPVCHECDVTDWNLDHIVPLSRGGSHDRSNLLLICAACNKSKGARTYTEWSGSPELEAELLALAADIAEFFSEET